MERANLYNPSGATVRAETTAKNGIMLVVIGAALWGIDPLFRILLLKTLTSAQLVLLEHILLLVFALPVLWRRRSELRGLLPKHLLAMLFIGWGGSAVATMLFTSAFAHGNPNTVLLLQKIQPLFAIGMARFVLKEALPRTFPALLIMALAGAYMLTFGLALPVGHWAELAAWGSLLSVGAAALWGGSTVMGRLLLDRMSFETVTAVRFVLALPLLAAVTWTEGAPWHMPSGAVPMMATAGNLLLQAFLPGLLSLLLYYRGLSGTKASYATLAELAFPAVGVLLNWLVFHQPVTMPQLAGFALIWFALYFVSREESQAP
ncbi:DMT family transporter [Paenibacillus hamazuiensis]|uniref:DMT family transporter n=1 Tax=Paenibacillus hamazuiensis TaxID=2936508 RepID=UPI00200FDF16|nr:DMT family transporter [Paenibacillus hamazuiensis]